MEYIGLSFYILFFAFIIWRHWYGKYLRSSYVKSMEKEKRHRYQSIGADIAEYNSVYKSHDTSDLVYLLQPATCDNSSDSDGGGSDD